MSLTGEPGSIPTKAGVSVVDILGSVYAALCTVAALFRAERTGKGGDADTNLFDIALNSTCYQGLWFLNDGFVAGKQPRSAHTTQVPSQLFRTGDGWIYKRSTDQWLELLSGTIPSAPVDDIGQAFENPFVRASGKIIAIPYGQSPKRKEVEFIAPPFSFDGERFTSFSIGPRLGEHTGEILESVGYSADEIRRLEEKQIIIASRLGGSHE
jgi:succinate--hydroxymethylglutarate CoA-transferase